LTAFFCKLVNPLVAVEVCDGLRITGIYVMKAEVSLDLGDGPDVGYWEFPPDACEWSAVVEPFRWCGSECRDDGGTVDHCGGGPCGVNGEGLSG